MFVKNADIFFVCKEMMISEMIRICYRCKNKVYPSDTTNYPYQCFVHDEDLFGIETELISEENYIERLSHRLHCSKETAVKIDKKYDSYVSVCRIRGDVPMKIEKFYSKNKEKDIMRG